MAWRAALEDPARRSRPTATRPEDSTAVAWGAASWSPTAPPAPSPPEGRGDLRYEFSLAPGPEFDTDTQAPDGSAAADEPLPTANGTGRPAADAGSSGNGGSSANGGTSSANDGDVDSGSAGATLQVTEASTESTTRTPGSTALALKPARGISKTRGSVPRPPARGNLSHTKMCRDRLNGMFERLRTTLPAAPVGVEVKHKAQVLDYAISVLKTMVRRTSELEIELAVSSNRATMEWISNLVASVPSFPEAASEVMRVFCKRRHWLQGELWLTRRINKRDIHLVFEASVTNDAEGALTPTGENIANFSEASRTYTFSPDEGVQGRVWSSMRPEWLAGLTDGKTFARAGLAHRFGIKTCLAVPIMITGKIEAVMCFYDTKHRPYDSQCVDLAMRLTWALGNATGGKRAGEADS